MFVGTRVSLLMRLLPPGGLGRLELIEDLLGSPEVGTDTLHSNLDQHVVIISSGLVASVILLGAVAAALIENGDERSGVLGLAVVELVVGGRGQESLGGLVGGLGRGGSSDNGSSGKGSATDDGPTVNILSHHGHGASLGNPGVGEGKGRAGGEGRGDGGACRQDEATSEHQKRI